MEKRCVLQLLYPLKLLTYGKESCAKHVQSYGDKRLKRIYILSLILITIILAATVSVLVSYTQSSSNKETSPIYIGVTFCGNTTNQAYALIDRVKSYTNVFVLDSGINPISDNLTAAREICDYAINSGLYLIINLGTWTPKDWTGKVQFLNESRSMYGQKFLSVYYDDEPGGIELDYNWTKYFQETTFNVNQHWNASIYTKKIYANLQDSQITGIPPDNYTLEAKWFNSMLTQNLGVTSLKKYNLPYLTSDYALYWFDYIGQYQTLLAQIGWNSSIEQQISQIRGAATLQNKTWGSIITWKYNLAPYLDTPDNIYEQMVDSYKAGAKYIIIFNYSNGTQIDPYGGAMTDAHFQALQNFWNRVATKSTPNTIHAQAALVLPKDYGFGLRRPDDRIWGFWDPDSKSPIIWNISQTLLTQYGLKLDIVYDDPEFPVTSGNYSEIYYWNQTIS
jgi:hypothetical protein